MKEVEKAKKEAAKFKAKRDKEKEKEQEKDKAQDCEEETLEDPTIILPKRNSTPTAIHASLRAIRFPACISATLTGEI
jgi:ribosomal protein L9